MRIRFILYYADSTLTGMTIDEWRMMPDEGVLGVVEVTDRSYGHPPKHAGVRHAYRDYYWMDSKGEIGSGSAKLIPEGVYVKRGKYIDDRDWEEIYNNRIMIDPPYGTPG